MIRIELKETLDSIEKEIQDKLTFHRKLDNQTDNGEYVSGYVKGKKEAYEYCLTLINGLQVLNNYGVTK